MIRQMKKRKVNQRRNASPKGCENTSDGRNRRLASWIWAKTSLSAEKNLEPKTTPRIKK
jgi:hypothetical protein